MRERHPDVEIELSAPLGDDPRLVEIVLEQLEAQLSRERQSS
jgi:sirohydrochlorin ferrochelatase